MTFLPSFLLAIFYTLDLTNKKSLSVLISHPYLVLLPTFTFISFSKLKICGDRRVALSPNLTAVNMLVNAVLFGIGFAMEFHFVVCFLVFIFSALLLTLLFLLPPNVNKVLNAVVLPVMLTLVWIFNTVVWSVMFMLMLLWKRHILFLPFLLSALFSFLFLFLKKISCCSCCRSAGRLVKVFDPEQPDKNFIMEGGRVVELTETDVEQGGHTEMTVLEGLEVLIDLF